MLQSTTFCKLFEAPKVFQYFTRNCVENLQMEQSVRNCIKKRLTRHRKYLRITGTVSVYYCFFFQWWIFQGAVSRPFVLFWVLICFELELFVLIVRTLPPQLRKSSIYVTYPRESSTYSSLTEMNIHQDLVWIYKIFDERFTVNCQIRKGKIG